MLSKTTISAVRTLIYVAERALSTPVPPKLIAERLGESPTYLAKVTQSLARAGILRSRRGVAGGVFLNRPPERITLLAIVEACQGAVLGDFCQQASPDDLQHACAFHHAAVQLHQAITGVLSAWTLADLLEKPFPTTEHLQERCLLMSGSFAVPKTGVTR